MILSRLRQPHRSAGEADRTSQVDAREVARMWLLTSAAVHISRDLAAAKAAIEPEPPPPDAAPVPAPTGG